MYIICSDKCMCTSQCVVVRAKCAITELRHRALFLQWDDGKTDTVDGGFSDLYISASEAKVVYFDNQGNDLYSATMKPRPVRH
jgi:hypothetical protein